MSRFELLVVTPETTALQQPVDAVALPAVDGELGVLAHHAPLIARLAFGEMRITDGNATRRYYVDGGFAQIANNVVSVLTGRAIPAAELNAAQLERSLDQALSAQSDDPTAEAARQRSLAQTRAMLRVARSQLTPR